MIKDLIWSEKSPAVVAIAINLAITFTPMVVWIVQAILVQWSILGVLNWQLKRQLL